MRVTNFAQSPSRLAQDLLGTTLVRVLPDGTRLSGRIVETEAYCGVLDRAAHSFGGRRTRRNESMYARAGTAYVYFTYGMHHCFNVVCGEVDEPVAVLVRALEPLEGIERMRGHRLAFIAQRRHARGAPCATPPDFPDALLCSGPGRLCQALAIDRSLDGEDLTRSNRLFVEGPRAGAGSISGPNGASAGRADTLPMSGVVNAPRVGVASAGEWALRPLRWYIMDSPHVSVRERSWERATNRGDGT